MRKIYSLKLILVITGIVINISGVYSQSTDVPPAGFDVIITNNGDIINGKVMEVGLKLIKYKRTDIPDGPVYEIPRNEVYAISYRNQLKEYISPVDSSVFGYPPVGSKLKSKKGSGNNKLDSTSLRYNIQYGDFRIGLGYIRNMSKVSGIDEYKSEFGLPGIFMEYIFPYKSNLDLGFSAGWAKFKYTSNQFSEYDMLMIDKTIKEALFSISAFAKYSFNAKPFTPYLMGGISYINSNVRSDSKISFTEDGRIVAVQGGGRSGSPGFVLRAGTDFKISEEISFYADFGTGLTFIQFGGVFKLKKNIKK